MCTVTSQLKRLLSDNVSYYGASGMSRDMGSGILQGRPYGGVAMVWNKQCNQFIKTVSCDQSGRCCCIKVQAGNRSVLVVNVYFPCLNQNKDYFVQLDECLGFIDCVLSNESYTDAVIVGDTNFVCNEGNTGYDQLLKLLSNFIMSHCDNFISDDNNRFTYVNDALGHKSCIDHVFVTQSLVPDIQK